MSESAGLTDYEIQFVSLNVTQNQIFNQTHIDQLFQQQYEIKTPPLITFNHQVSATEIQGAPGSRLIASLLFYYQQEQKKTYQYFILNELQTIPSLTLKLISERVTSSLDRKFLRDVLFVPGNQQIYLFTAQKVGCYMIENNTQPNATPRSVFTLSQSETWSTNLPSNTRILETMIHPSGRYLLASANNTLTSQFKMFKISQGLLQQFPTKETNCIGGFPYQQGSIEFDSSSEHGFITANQNVICYWNGASLTLEARTEMAPLTSMPNLLVYGEINENIPTMPESLTFVRYLKGQGLILLVDQYVRYCHFYKYDRANKTLEYQYTTSIWSSFNPDVKIELVPLEIPILGSILYYQITTNYLQLTKLLHQRNGKERTLKQIQLKQHKDFIDQAFYLQRQASVCIIMNSTLHCDVLSLKDNTKNKQMNLTSWISQCELSGKYWSSIYLSCQECPENIDCACREPSLDANPYSGECQLDCSAVSGAVPLSSYLEKGVERCYCANRTVWSVENNICFRPCTSDNAACSCPLGQKKGDNGCVVDCSQVKYAVGSNTSAQQCVCQEGFTYINKLGETRIGRCEFMCEGSLPLWKKGKPYCPCPSDHLWDSQQLECRVKSANSRQAGLIVLGILLALSILALIIFCFLKRRKSKGKSEQAHAGASEGMGGAATDERLGRDRNMGSQIEPLCHICGSGGINCEGICGHEFHYECIKRQMEAGNPLCPFCQRELNLADICIISGIQTVVTQ